MIEIVVLPPEPPGISNATEGDLHHVLLVFDLFARMIGGEEHILLKLAALLSRYGYRVPILTFSGNMRGFTG
jgi:hypothetical protein